MLKMLWPKQSLATVSLWLLLLLQFRNAVAFIVPQELPSLLSVVYSNIPPIKKGTDSRLGFGFRLGEHADFQVMVELGPQKETRPVGEQSKDDQSFNKRQVSATDQRAVLRKQLQQEQQWQEMTSTERNAVNWLESWSQSMKPEKPQQKLKPKTTTTQPAIALPEQPPSLAFDTVQQLRMLYKMATSTSTTAPSSSPSITTTTPAPFEGGPLNLGGPSGFKLPPPALAQDFNSLGTPAPIKNKTQITKVLMDVSLDDE